MINNIAKKNNLISGGHWLFYGSQNMQINKILLSCLLIVFVFIVRDSTAQVTSNVYTRVLKIQVGKVTGSAFTLDVDGRQYLITAKHMVDDLKKEDSIDIYKGDQWLPLGVKVLKCADPIDIAILVPSEVLTPSLPLDTISNSHQFLMGQEAYFAGFPFGLHMSGNNLNGDYPLAMVKKDNFSATFTEDGANIIALDGFNNHGFSGGPVVFRDISKQNSPLYVVGVISGFRPELSAVMKPEKIEPGDDMSKVERWRIVKLKDGQNAVLRDTDQIVGLNTGIIISYSIQHAIDFIRTNPIGPKISQQEKP